MKLEEFVSLLIIALVVVLIGLVIWARIAAPCVWLDWLPVMHVPARCLP